MKLYAFVSVFVVVLFCSILSAQEIWLNVDAAVTVVVNKKPLVAAADGLTIDEGVTYDEAGLDMVWNFITTAGAVTQTAFDPCDSGGDYDWTHVGNGIYKIEIPASGGADMNNDTEGFGWITGTCTACLPWSSPVYGFRNANKNDLEIDDGTAGTNQDDFYDGTGYEGGTARLAVDIREVNDTAVASASLHDYAGATTSVANIYSDIGTMDEPNMHDEIIATLDEQGLTDTVIGYISYLANETYGLSAIETLVDDLESRLTANIATNLGNVFDSNFTNYFDDTNGVVNSRVVYVSDAAGTLTGSDVQSAADAAITANASIVAILEDTGTTLDGIVDAILVDTGTTIPGTITTLSNDVNAVAVTADSVLEDTATTIPGTITTLTADVNAVGVLAESIEEDTQDIQTQIGTAGDGLTDIPLGSVLDETVDGTGDMTLEEAIAYIVKKVKGLWIIGK